MLYNDVFNVALTEERFIGVADKEFVVLRLTKFHWDHYVGLTPPITCRRLNGTSRSRQIRKRAVVRCSALLGHTLCCQL